jgi:hypothetical protein
VKLSIRPDIRPYIRYPALTGYLAGYPVSGFWISRISGQKQYPVYPYTVHCTVHRIAAPGNTNYEGSVMADDCPPSYLTQTDVTVNAIFI